MGGEKRQSDRLSKKAYNLKVPKLNEKTSSKEKKGRKDKSLPATTSKDCPKDSDLNRDFFTDNYENVVNVINQLQRGFCKASTLQQIVERRTLYNLRFCCVIKNFENHTSPRITAMQWHPRLPYALAIGGKHGDLTFWSNFNGSDQTQAEFLPTGPGGTMEAMRFNTKVSGVQLCTASVEGTLSTYNFETLTRQILAATDDRYNNWFCSVDVHEDGKTVSGGDNKGVVAVHHTDSGSTDKLKLHMSKVKHLEFSPRDPNLMVTSSLDKTVKLWDLRKIKDKKSCIEDLQHKVGVSAAKFSLTDGCRLLTCDMDHELRVYKAPHWTLEYTIDHPHRCFQHMTNITPSWHTSADVFAIGCYPDPKLPQFAEKRRSVDIFSATKGTIVNELMDSSRLITSLSNFNSTGHYLATTSGKTVYFWRSINTHF